MNIDDRTEYIKKLQESDFKVEPQQTVVLGNFYAIVTIIAVCISLLYYSNYIMPQIKTKEEKQLQQEKQIKEHQQYLEQRTKRIALSHKLNAKEYQNIDKASTTQTNRETNETTK